MTYSVINKYYPEFPTIPYRVEVGMYHWWSDDIIMSVFNDFAFKLKRKEGNIEWITDSEFKCNGIVYKIQPYK